MKYCKTLKLTLIFIISILIISTGSFANNTNNPKPNKNGYAIVQVQPSPENVYNEIETISGWYRYLDTSGHRAAENYIYNKFQDFDLNTTRQEYIGHRRDGDVRCVNILGQLEGTLAPNIWLVIGGHYDAHKYATSAAYDNAAGAGSVIELARTFTEHYETQDGPEISIMFATWDAEEGGGAGSSHFVNNLPDGIKVVTYINLDMFSLNYPIKNSIPGASEEYFKLYLYTSPIQDFSGYSDSDFNESTIDNFTILQDLLKEITYTHYNFPSQWVLVMDDTEVASDHSFFIRNNIPAVWFRGMNEYPKNEGDINERNFKHTPADTLETMEFYAGGKPELLTGIETGLNIAYELALGVLNLTSMEYQAQLEAQEQVGADNEADIDANILLIAIVVSAVIFICGYLYRERRKKR